MTNFTPNSGKKKISSHAPLRSLLFYLLPESSTSVVFRTRAIFSVYSYYCFFGQSCWTLQEVRGASKKFQIILKKKLNNENVKSELIDKTQKKPQSHWQEWNPWPHEHRVDALSTELRALMESKVNKKSVLVSIKVMHDDASIAKRQVIVWQKCT